LTNVRRNINFDIKHGVTSEEVAEFLEKVQNDSSFSNQRKIEGSNERIKELQQQKE
jgi:cell division septum initiation protein DivIVA